ncbi:thioredoxin family protein [Leadbetterella byssophila]|jgi:thioredoxin 1|uniref:Disulfide-isomerase n=1 Tax=Leadbetterella byssophila (strain DSM 17132 / JCM 16389 / KACC 11308 / NBRC 106382 / 4M15) TaxID=649349 RepID=E4RZU9_LEAB4|nr:thioredoxin family protein [Leadbetterella byssophila]ADQ19241.1 putative disulfide-isomerase [Leadbetterella byssophila DSM 17132]
MRRIGFIIFLLGSNLAFAQNSGIDFESTKWKEVVKRAKEENKLIFFDAYTTWCSPCHKLQNQVFPDKTLGEYYNRNFINVKYDMERGEGITLSRKYTIQVYPTLLFIDPRSEKVVNHAIGFKSVEQLLQLAEQAMSRTNW